MADQGSNPGSPDNASKARLTETEKKQNHILSEKKRRDAIRAGFDNICDLVPGLKGHGRSEAMVLGKTVDYMRELQEQKAKMRNGWIAAGRNPAELDALFEQCLQQARQKQEERGALLNPTPTSAVPPSVGAGGSIKGPGNANSAAPKPPRSVNVAETFAPEPSRQRYKRKPYVEPS